jgi:ribosomal protein S12 methylthiotransferase
MENASSPSSGKARYPSRHRLDSAPLCLSRRLPPEVLPIIRDYEAICKYLDMPLQHISDRILKAMRRGLSKKRTIELMEKIRQEVPGIVLRSTFIVGFPGETDEDFQELLDFLRHTA